MRYLRYTGLSLCVVCAALASAAYAFQRSSPHAAPRPSARAIGDTIHPHVRELWRVPIAGRFIGLPATDQAGVVVTAGETQVVAISRDGAVDWTTAVDGAVANAPRIDRDRVFVAAKRVVVALARDSGEVLWSTATSATSDTNRANRPVVAGDTVVVSAADGLVFGLDRATGSERWRITLPTATTAEPAVGAVAGGPPVIVVVGVAEWWGIDPATGSILWSGDIGVFGTSSPVVYPDGLDLVAAVASDGHVLAVDARSGAARWDAAGEQAELFQVPVLGDHGNELLVPDHFGRIAAYDPHTGKRTWATKGDDTSAEFGEPVWLGERFVAVSLDARGPRLASPAGAYRLRPPVDGTGVADLPSGGLVVTTGGKPTNYVLLYDVSYH
jgi:outer membrane protein assembly factor BamB